MYRDMSSTRLPRLFFYLGSNNNCDLPDRLNLGVHIYNEGPEQGASRNEQRKQLSGDIQVK